MLASEDDGDRDALRFSRAGDIVELVVLTTDDLFLQTLRDALGGARRLWHVAAPDQVSNLLLAGEVGILVLDAHCVQSDAAVLLTRIKHQFPDLVLIVAGGRDDEASLASLISSGLIYRFIHKPLSPGRAKLFADAAVRKHVERRARAPALFVPHRRFGLTETVAVAGLSVIIVGAATWALVRRGRSADTAQTSLPALATPAVAPGAAPQPAPATERDRLLSAAQDALLEERLDAAATTIAAARQAGADKGRLALLSAQLARARERRAAAAQKHAKSDPAATLAGAADERLTRLLSFAAERIESGQLVDPPNDNARLYVEEALRLDPDTNATQAAKRSLALALLAETHRAIDRRDFARAGALLEGAVGIVATPNLDNLRGQLAGARAQAAAEAANQPPAAGPEPSSAVARTEESAAAAASPPQLPREVVPAGELTVLKSVSPTYPRRAEMDRTEGWVELDFTVTPSGTVKDITVHGAKPAGVFNDAAISALAQWRYKPVERAAQPVAQRARIRIRFALSG